MIVKLLYWILNYATGHATAKAYTSRDAIGTRLGGHDIPEVQNFYLIVDFRVADKIILLGYFQFT